MYQRIVNKIKQIYLVYELRTAISMLEPWEKRMFSILLFLLYLPVSVEHFRIWNKKSFLNV